MLVSASPTNRMLPATMYFVTGEPWAVALTALIFAAAGAVVLYCTRPEAETRPETEREVRIPAPAEVVNEPEVSSVEA